ncbi:MAG: hypothetical protein JO246_14805 [Frankiaceae bacterium]|nr:hypothetical protein [Frankiaceae bacterium]MBV9869055.1 hypothetical protein [Frankiaceae bacterium]
MRRLMVALVGIGALCTACGSSSSGGTDNPVVQSNSSPPTGGSTAGGQAPAITQTWTTFFNYQTSAADRQALLEDGASLGKAMAMGDKFAKAQHLEETVNVKHISLDDATHASVSYDILSHGTVLLPDATGTAVQINGEWLVAKQSFCGLIELGAGGKTVPGCSAAS